MDPVIGKHHIEFRFLGEWMWKNVHNKTEQYEDCHMNPHPMDFMHDDIFN